MPSIREILTTHLTTSLSNAFGDDSVVQAVRAGAVLGKESVRFIVLPGGKAFPDQIATPSNSNGIDVVTYQSGGQTAYWRRFIVQYQLLLDKYNRDEALTIAYELQGIAEGAIARARVPGQMSDQGECAFFVLVVETAMDETPVDKRPRWEGYAKVQFLTVLS